MALSNANDLISVNIEYQEFVVNINSGFCKQFDTADVSKNVLKASKHSNLCDEDFHTILIRYCTALSPCSNWYAVVTANKTLLLRETRTWSVISERKIERRASKILFTPKSECIILTDKTGDVYSYSVTNPSEKGKFLLGHVSVLLDVLITSDEKFIITCDRDEKIRVSHYPNTYNIRSFCLGHTEYVIKIKMLDDETLISASGDGTLKFWNYKHGTLLSTHFVYHDIDVADCDSSKSIHDMSAVFKRREGSHLCISINKLHKILVYQITDDLTVTCIQKIDTYSEPLSILLNSVGLLFILLATESRIPLMKIMIWDNETFNTGTDKKIQNSVQALNSLFQNSELGNHKSNINNLYKNFKLNISNFKRVKKC